MRPIRKGLNNGEEEAMTEGSNIDYWFLRENGIPAKTALRMLAIAYKTEKREENVKRQTQEEWLEEISNTGVGEEL